jgi:hypothetical protein
MGSLVMLNTSKLFRDHSTEKRAFRNKSKVIRVQKEEVKSEDLSGII